jgi:hypothetical protein
MNRRQEAKEKQMAGRQSANQNSDQSANQGNRFSSYEEFFLFYLHEHSDRRNRWMHAAGTTLGLATVIGAFATGHGWYALLWPVIAYGFAWTGHFMIEGNKPATFGHPFWSFISDFRMLALMATGKLESRLKDSPEAASRLSS